MKEGAVVRDISLDDGLYFLSYFKIFLPYFLLELIISISELFDLLILHFRNLILFLHFLSGSFQVHFNSVKLENRIFKLSNLSIFLGKIGPEIFGFKFQIFNGGELPFEIVSLYSSLIVLFLKSFVLHFKISILLISGLSFLLQSGYFILLSFHLFGDKSDLFIMTVVFSNVGLAGAS